MKDDKDMIRHMRRLYAKRNKLLHICSHFTPDVKLVLFDSYCTSLYCPFLWTDYTKRTFSKLRVAFNCSCRHTCATPVIHSHNYKPHTMLG